jgi:DMSO/TMAO reductase YedYZ heme-binding membrane subunit
MITLPFIAIIILLGYFFSKQIRKYSNILYIIFTILAVFATIFRNVPVFLPFYKAFFGLAIFYVVMIIGILDRKKSLYKRLYSVRAELSIIGFIILTPHAIFYLIDKLFYSGMYEIIGLLTYIIMVPLFITSFKKIRKKFQFYNWKKIQNFAYIAYILLFVHLIISASLQINLILYIILFVPYIIYKPIHYLKYEKDFYRKVKDNYKKKGEVKC